MSEHTKEPWAIDPDDRLGMEWNNHIVSVANPDRTICFMSHDGTAENIEFQANARRIVYCVNACAGMTTEEIEADIVVGGYRALLACSDSVIATLEQQVAELVEALERARTAFITNGDRILDDIYDDYINRLGMSVDFKECYAAQITGALSKVKQP